MSANLTCGEPELISDDSFELAVRLSQRARRLIRDLVRVREQRGYDRSQVADAIGIHKSGVSRFERQEKSPRLDTLLRYAHAVGADVTFYVEPAGGWTCEDSKVVRRIDTWGKATSEDSDEPEAEDERWEEPQKAQVELAI